MYKGFNEKNHAVLLRSLDRLESKLQRRSSFIIEYGEVFKLPKRLSARNLNYYKKVQKAILVLRELQISHFK